MVDTRGDRPAAARRLRSSSWLGPAGLALRRPRRDLAGDPQRRRPLPGGHRRHRRARLAARARASSDDVRVRRHRARRDLQVHRPRRDLRARARPLGPPAPRRSGTPGSAARPSTRSCRTPRSPDVGPRRDLDRRRLPRPTTAATSWYPSNTGVKARVHARGAQLPRVRPVRAQGDPPPRAARPAVPAEPRRRLPLRRRRRQLAGHRATGCPSSSASRSSSTRTTRTRVYAVPDQRRRRPLARRRPRPRLALDATRGASWEPLGDGSLPDDYYVAVMRDAMCADDTHDTHGLYFGGRNGAVWASPDAGRDLDRDPAGPARRHASCGPPPSDSAPRAACRGSLRVAGLSAASRAAGTYTQA